PQAFQASLIRAALTEATEQKLAVTDDCSAVEAIGLPVAVVDGDEEISRSRRRWTSCSPRRSSGGETSELSHRTRL
ncbi:MAG: 2-C-methyl-D-erythritol 4-phosphate cytidylyltransferase, partial [Oscillospiraceae bacterium]|nr:2-C-methyl-D-erythritol 4-phosphate cytidylyltransferase [Oscillospiraceae bacterium]